MAGVAGTSTGVGLVGARRRVAVIGAGWAGCAAAVRAAQQGWDVTLYDMAPQVGGRARAQQPNLAHSRDNGQHIMLGAYRHTLQAMRAVDVQPKAVFDLRPLDLRLPDGSGLRMPRWPGVLPATLAGAWALVCTKGWPWSARWALARALNQWTDPRYAPWPGQNVAQLTHALPAVVQREWVEPLCVSALNLPPAQASAEVWIRVLADALGGSCAQAMVYLPKQHLSACFPEPARRWLLAQGAQVRLGHRVQSLSHQNNRWRLSDDSTHDAVVLACGAPQAATLAASCAVSTAEHWASTARALQHTAIATVWVGGAKPLTRPMVQLRSGPEQPAQFVFDAAALRGQAGELAAVVSHSTLPNQELADLVTQQLRDQLGMPELVHQQTVQEKRATFACTPQAVRPPGVIWNTLWAAGDYVAGPYPATLEGAVRSAHMLPF